MKIQFAFVFDLKNRAIQPKQKGLIELRAYLHRKRFYYSTKIEIYRKEWNENRKEVNERNPDSALLNIQLRKTLTGIENLQTEHIFKDKPFTLDNVKEYFKNKKAKPKSYIDFVKAELEADKLLTAKTKTQHLNTIKKNAGIYRTKGRSV